MQCLYLPQNFTEDSGDSLLHTQRIIFFFSFFLGFFSGFYFGIFLFFPLSFFVFFFPVVFSRRSSSPISRQRKGKKKYKGKRNKKRKEKRGGKNKKEGKGKKKKATKFIYKPFRFSQNPFSFGFKPPPQHLPLNTNLAEYMYKYTHRLCPVYICIYIFIYIQRVLWGGWGGGWNLRSARK